MTLWNEEADAPLRHLRIIDATVMLPGGLITRILAQYGADVLKIEGLPGGDPTREWQQSALSSFLNQGKKSLALNLKDSKGVELVRRLVAEADVFVENFRDGVMEKMGLGYAALSQVNPDLLYVSVRGLSGVNAARAAHDLNFIAASGCGEWFLESGHPNYSTQFGDLIAGAYLPALQLMIQLANPNRAGRHLVCRMDECFRALYLPRAFDTFQAERMDAASASTFGIMKATNGTKAHSRYYRCRDGYWISLNAVQEKHWHAFCEVSDRATWKDRQNDPALVPEVEKMFADAPSTYWESLAAEKDLCLWRVIPWQEHMMTSQARTQLGLDPLNWSGFAPNANLIPAPDLGSHTFAALQSIGVPQAELQHLLKAGVIVQASKLPSEPAK